MSARSAWPERGIRGRRPRARRWSARARTFAGGAMDDPEVLNRIGTLVEQERELRERHGTGGLTEAELDQLHGLEEALDQCWDLLRQRRGRRADGDDPPPGGARDSDTGARYQE